MGMWGCGEHKKQGCPSESPTFGRFVHISLTSWFIYLAQTGCLFQIPPHRIPIDWQLDGRLEKGRGMRCCIMKTFADSPKTAAKKQICILRRRGKWKLHQIFTRPNERKWFAKRSSKKFFGQTGNAFQSVWQFAMLAKLIFDSQINFFLGQLCNWIMMKDYAKIIMLARLHTEIF